MENRLDSGDVYRFVMAGDARFTIVSKVTGTRFTYRIRAKDDGAIHFVSVLTGPDNDSSYKYLGWIRNGEFVHGARRSSISPDAPSAKAFRWFWSRIDRLPEHLVEVYHMGRCGRCARALTVPESIRSGIGPECAKKMGFCNVVEFGLDDAAE